MAYPEKPTDVVSFGKSPKGGSELSRRSFFSRGKRSLPPEASTVPSASINPTIELGGYEVDTQSPRQPIDRRAALRLIVGAGLAGGVLIGLGQLPSVDTHQQPTKPREISRQLPPPDELWVDTSAASTRDVSKQALNIYLDAYPAGPTLNDDSRERLLDMLTHVHAVMNPYMPQRTEYRMLAGKYAEILLNQACTPFFIRPDKTYHQKLDEPIKIFMDPNPPIDPSKEQVEIQKEQAAERIYRVLDRINEINTERWLGSEKESPHPVENV